MTDAEGVECYAFPKITSNKIVVKHLGKEVPLTELFSSEVMSDDILHKLDEEVIRPLFELPSQDSMEDLKEMFEDETN